VGVKFDGAIDLASIAFSRNNLKVMHFIHYIADDPAVICTTPARDSFLVLLSQPVNPEYPPGLYSPKFNGDDVDALDEPNRYTVQYSKQPADQNSPDRSVLIYSIITFTTLSIFPSGYINFLLLTQYLTLLLLALHSAWTTIGVLPYTTLWDRYKGLDLMGARGLVDPQRRRVWNLARPVKAHAIRIILASATGASAQLDEVEAYQTQFPQVMGGSREVHRV